MSKSYLLDTCILVDYTRQAERNLTLLYNLAKTKPNLYISIVTHTELYAGTKIWANSTAFSGLERVIGGLNILPLTTEISKKAGQIKAQHNIGLIDAIIAATSLANSLDLVTFNMKHFINIKGLKIIDKL